MVAISNEVLMAYADGQLDRTECERVEAVLASEPAVRARFAVFAATGTCLAGHFRKPMDEPIPQHFIDLIERYGHATGVAKRSTAGQWLSLGDMVRQTVAAFLPRPAMALAYSMVLLVGAGIGFALQGIGGRAPDTEMVRSGVNKGAILAQGTLRQALETAASGAMVTSNGVGEPVAAVKTRLTFKSQSQGFCRQYELKLQDGSQFAGIGCRDDGGSWRVQMHTPIAGRATAGDRVVLADDPNAALAALVDRLMEGDSFGAAEEATLIRRQWRP